VFSCGIVTLASLAIVLVVMFEGSTSLLIPLYAIGVFLSLTMSQDGMVVRWNKVRKLQPGDEIQTEGSVLRHDSHWRAKQAINAVGCVLTGIVMVVFAVTKFSQGAWIVVILIPLLVIAFFRVHHHYQQVKQALSLQARPIDVRTHPVETIVLINDIHQGTMQMVSFAKSLGKPWVAVHVAVRPEKTARVLQKWNDYLGDHGSLYVIPSPYRSLAGPVVKLVREIKREHPDAFVNIIMAQLVTTSLWGQLLHRNSGPVFKFAFQQMQGVAVTDVHYRIAEAEEQRAHAS